MIRIAGRSGGGRTIRAEAVSESTWTGSTGVVPGSITSMATGGGGSGVEPLGRVASSSGRCEQQGPSSCVAGCGRQPWSWAAASPRSHAVGASAVAGLATQTPGKRKPETQT